jgi:hypothetical protein
MNYFPHNPFKRSASPAEASLGSVRQKRLRDILWGQPLFKAPALPNPQVPIDPLPFIAERITQQRATQS